MSNNQLNFPKLGLPIIFAVIIVIIFFSKSFVTVDAGEAGVLWKRFSGGVVIDATSTWRRISCGSPME